MESRPKMFRATCSPVIRTPTASATKVCGTSTPSRTRAARYRGRSSPPARCSRNGKRRKDAKREAEAGGRGAEAARRPGRRRRRTVPTRCLYRQLTSLGGPLLGGSASRISSRPSRCDQLEGRRTQWGLDPALFGKHPNGAAIDAASLCVRAPSVIEVRLPADLVAGCEFVTTGVLIAETGAEGSVQLQVVADKPARTPGLLPSEVTVTAANGPWTADNRRTSLRHADPRQRRQRGAEAHRSGASTSSASCSPRRCATRRSCRSMKSSRSRSSIARTTTSRG